MSSDTKFSDLATRIKSAIVMALVGGVGLWQGDIWFVGIVSVAAGIMAWETLRMHDASSVLLAIGSISFTVAVALMAFIQDNVIVYASIGLVVLLGLAARRFKIATMITLAIIALACVSLVVLRDNDVSTLILLCLCVVASDVGGYFAGRIFGGPKLWPAVSPKKTWSGTIGGWVLAALVGLVFYLTNLLPISAIPIAVVFAIAAQAGDLAESSLKRRAGIKDSSNLIPGHGGFMDRFDGFMGAASLAGILAFIFASGA